jgi:ABC-2 type transport system ATP-binding protein
VIDDGRVVALDSPAGLVGDLDGGQRMRFRPSAPLDERPLLDLPEVTAVRPAGSARPRRTCGCWS